MLRFPVDTPVLTLVLVKSQCDPVITITDMNYALLTQTFDSRPYCQTISDHHG